MAIGTLGTELNLRRVLSATILAVAAVGWRTAQELDWVPKDVVLFPLLILFLWALLISWVFSWSRFISFYNRYLPGKRGLMVSIIVGALIGAISGGAWWKLVLLHKARMAELESKFTAAQDAYT